MSAVPRFGPLAETDSLVWRIEKIWNLRPSTIEVSVGYCHPEDDAVVDWSSKTAMGRKAAADALRAARRQGLQVERVRNGYAIFAGLNPAWRHA